ncbi:MAG: hypothetical protein ABNH53_08185 [Henriciella sp.]|jgi:hypothetical protein
MLKSVLSAFALVITLSACNSSTETVSDADKLTIDCLASKTVIEITDGVKKAILDGKSQGDLRSIQNSAIDAGAETLSSKFPRGMHEAYFEFETNRRLTAMQNALSNRAPNSPDQLTMDETIDMVQTCVF